MRSMPQFQRAVRGKAPLDGLLVAVQTELALAAAFQFYVVIALVIDIVHGEPVAVPAGGDALTDIFPQIGVGGVSAVLTAAGSKGEHHHQSQCQRYYLFHT